MDVSSPESEQIFRSLRELFRYDELSSSCSKPEKKINDYNFQILEYLRLFIYYMKIKDFKLEVE